ncbi:MAG: ATP-binding cassette domain-containing protein [Pseudomonadota bacterium]
MLEAVGISIALGGKQVLDNVSFTAHPGEVVAVIGPNGAGKSTLLNCLTGALKPHQGRVSIDGLDPTALAPAEMARLRAVLEQSPVTAARFTVGELIGLALPREIPPRKASEFMNRAAAAVDLNQFLKQPVSALSGGEHHRAHMARALAQLWAGREMGGGKWLLLDEPAANLDLGHQDAVLRAARAAAKAGAGVITILHELTLAAAVADRIVLMHRGEILVDRPVETALDPAQLSSVYGIQISVDALPNGARAVNPLFSSSNQGAA